MWGSDALRCGVGKEKRGVEDVCRGRCKGGFRGCGEVWKEVRGHVRRGVGTCGERCGGK